jgi:diguanylate cyclase (GGDEF)-like protein
MPVPRSTTDIAARIATLRAAFAGQIPTQLLALRKLHEELEASAWARETLAALIARVHEFTGSATTFGFNEMGEAARALEIALRAIQANPLLLDGDQRTTIAGRIKALLELPVPDPDHLAPLLPPRFDHSPSERHPDHRLIYVVDDNELITRQLAEQIGYFGYEVKTFNTLADFSAAYQAQPPSAVVLDIEFPDEEDSGPSMFGRLIHERGESTPVVFISAHDDIQSRLAAARAGGSRYLLKPVVVGELIDAIEGMLNTTPPIPYRVLVVDDSHAIGQLYCGLLEGAGMKVQVTTDPLQALDMLAEFQPDLALIDLYMPECSGQELATVIRQLDAHVGMPIVFLSAETDRKRQIHALQLGADDFLTKPVQPDFLIASVATRAERARQMRGLLQRDNLTGLLNHSSFLEAANTEFARTRRNQMPCTLAMIDLDHFKQINEIHRHATGDQVLRSIARQLRQRLRSVDLIGRYGGEEFAVILSGTDGRTALRVFNGIREDFARIVHSSASGVFQTTFSVGIAGYPDFEEVSALLDAADRGLYEAKKRGRNQCVLAAPLPKEPLPV